MAEAGEQFRALGGFGGTLPGIEHLVWQRLGDSDGARRSEVEPAVHDDPGQPGPEGTRAVERVDVLERGEKGVLGQILGVFPMMKQPDAERERAIEVPLDERSKRVTIALTDTGHQLALFVGIDLPGIAGDLIAARCMSRLRSNAPEQGPRTRTGGNPPQTRT